MSTVGRNGKLFTVLASIVALGLLAAFSQLLIPANVAVAQDEKTPVRKPTQDEPGSADKKDEPQQALQRFMRQKLQASNLILEGLCTEDLKMVTDGAATLMKMSKEEKWRVSNDMMYRRYSKEFVNAVEELEQEAKDNDMDGTSMAWVNVTMKCLKCHEWVRNTVIADTAK
jgi:hypothetical protein